MTGQSNDCETYCVLFGESPAHNVLLPHQVETSCRVSSGRSSKKSMTTVSSSSPQVCWFTWSLNKCGPTIVLDRIPHHTITRGTLGFIGRTDASNVVSLRTSIWHSVYGHNYLRKTNMWIPLYFWKDPVTTLTSPYGINIGHRVSMLQFVGMEMCRLQ